MSLAVFVGLPAQFFAHGHNIIRTDVSDGWQPINWRWIKLSWRSCNIENKIVTAQDDHEK